MDACVSYSLRDGVATITLDDGKANALSLPMQAEINAALDRALADRAPLILSGRQGFFSAGFDMPTLTAGGEDAVEMLMGGFAIAERLLSFPRPIVVACSGHALAMGVFLVLCGDYCIGIEGNKKIGANEVAIGLTMPRTAIDICRNRLAPAHFNRAMLTSEIYSPAEAVAAGFLDKIVAEQDLANEALRIATQFTSLNMPAYEGTKQRLRAPLLETIRGTMQADRKTFQELFKLA